MRSSVRKQLSIGMAILGTVLVLSACSKSGGNDPAPDPVSPGTKRPFTDFALTVTRIQNDIATISYCTYKIFYELKNVSATDYIANSAPDEIALRFTITATDGTSYYEESRLSDLKAGKSYVSNVLIDYNNSKTIDSTKTKIEFFYYE